MTKTIKMFQNFNKTKINSLFSSRFFYRSFSSFSSSLFFIGTSFFNSNSNRSKILIRFKSNVPNYTKFSKWLYFKRTFKKKLLTNDLISLKFNEFKKEILDNLNDNDFILLFFKIRFIDGAYKTLGPLQKIQKSDFDDLLLTYKTILESKDKHYHTTPIDKLIFAYIVIPAEKLQSNNSKLSKPKDRAKVNTYKMFG
jgi:hypothetical protein